MTFSQNSKRVEMSSNRANSLPLTIAKVSSTITNMTSTCTEESSSIVSKSSILISLSAESPPKKQDVMESLRKSPMNSLATKSHSENQCSGSESNSCPSKMNDSEIVGTEMEIIGSKKAVNVTLNSPVIDEEGGSEHTPLAQQVPSDYEDFVPQFISEEMIDSSACFGINDVATPNC